MGGSATQSPRLTLLPPLTLRPTPGTRMDTTVTIPPTTGGDTTAGAILTDMATGAERRGRPSQRLSLLPPPMPTLRLTPGTPMDTTIPPTTGDTTVTATGPADTGGKSLGFFYRVHRSSRGTLINKKMHHLKQETRL